MQLSVVASKDVKDPELRHCGNCNCGKPAPTTSDKSWLLQAISKARLPHPGFCYFSEVVEDRSVRGTPLFAVTVHAFSEELKASSCHSKKAAAVSFAWHAWRSDYGEQVRDLLRSASESPVPFPKTAVDGVMPEWKTKADALLLSKRLHPPFFFTENSTPSKSGWTTKVRLSVPGELKDGGHNIPRGAVPSSDSKENVLEAVSTCADRRTSACLAWEKLGQQHSDLLEQVERGATLVHDAVFERKTWIADPSSAMKRCVVCQIGDRDIIVSSLLNMGLICSGPDGRHYCVKNAVCAVDTEFHSPSDLRRKAERDSTLFFSQRRIIQDGLSTWEDAWREKNEETPDFVLHLLQIATLTDVLVMYLGFSCELPKELIMVLESGEITKVGCGAAVDVQLLSRYAGTASPIVIDDLQALAHKTWPHFVPSLGLPYIARALGWKMPFKARSGFLQLDDIIWWDFDFVGSVPIPYSKGSIPMKWHYAIQDAWITFHCFLKLSSFD
jgi:hypothetical protein